MKKLILILLLIIILAPIALAADFNVDIEPVKSQISPTESALYNVSITNEGTTKSTYKIGIDATWDILSNPLSAYFSGIVLEPGEKTTTLLKLSPPSKSTSGAKRLNVEIESNDGEKISRSINVYIKAIGYGPQGYVPFVMSSLIVEPVSIDPRNKLTAKVKLKNGNVLNLTDVTLELTTRNNLFYKKRLVNLDPLEERTETFIITLNPLTEPSADSLIATVSYLDNYFQPAREIIEIVPFTNLVENKSVENKFLKIESTIELTNKGNQRISELYKVKTNLFRSLFITSNPDAKSLNQNDERYIVWEISLDPAQKITIKSTENYQPLLVFVASALIVLILYYLLRSKVVINKSAEVLEMEEGGISKIKIMLSVRNRSKRKIEHLKIIEKVPNISAYVKEDYVGTLKPSKILKHDAKGTLLKWDIDELEGFEERMITYKIKSRLTILGSMTLTPSVVKFRNPSGKITITHSNKHKLNMG
ncbi:MAG: hypothetical protein KAQ83_01950 [Nanoarchaeota archaeon]|nr:hypothetical protein [Nanoarchaeota archaeon]